jgi:hypothetical protein
MGMGTMIETMDRLIALGPRRSTRTGRPLIPAFFVLEDPAGYPIECPLCGQVDRWRWQGEREALAPRAFTCSHLAEAHDGAIIRRVAVIAIEQVGRYLDLTTLVPDVA